MLQIGMIHMRNAFMQNKFRKLDIFLVFTKLYLLREGTWNAPNSMWRRYFARDGICINFWNKTVEAFEPILIRKFQKQSTWSVFEQKKRVKMLDFGAFQKFMQMPSREKYLLRILFGAFQVPSRIWYQYKLSVYSPYS